MNSLIYESERYFKIWCHFVTHNQLLLRSDKDLVPERQNIDLVFFDVRYQEIPTSLWGVSIEIATEEEGAYIQNKHSDNISPGLSVFAITTGGRRFFIVAGRLLVYSNDLNSLNTGFVSIERTQWQVPSVSDGLICDFRKVR
jgi:hypothetical protein